MFKEVSQCGVSYGILVKLLDLEMPLNLAVHDFTVLKIQQLLNPVSGFKRIEKFRKLRGRSRNVR